MSETKEALPMLYAFGEEEKTHISADFTGRIIPDFIAVLWEILPLAWQARWPDGSVKDGRCCEGEGTRARSSGRVCMRAGGRAGGEGARQWENRVGKRERGEECEEGREKGKA